MLSPQNVAGRGRGRPLEGRSTRTTRESDHVHIHPPRSTPEGRAIEHRTDVLALPCSARYPVVVAPRSWATWVGRRFASQLYDSSSLQLFNISTVSIVATVRTWTRRHPAAGTAKPGHTTDCTSSICCLMDVGNREVPRGPRDPVAGRVRDTRLGTCPLTAANTVTVVRHVHATSPTRAGRPQAVVRPQSEERTGPLLHHQEAGPRQRRDTP